MQPRGEGSRKSGADAKNPRGRNPSAGPLIGPLHRAVMGMCLQRIQEAPDFCRDELTRREQRVHVERLADS